MKLQNKKTGEIREIKNILIDEMFNVNSLADLNTEWEDYEDPKEKGLDNIITLVESYSNNDSERYPKEIVEKFKAWKRLKDKGFEFKCWEYDDRYATELPCILIRAKKIFDCEKDLDLLFGGE